MAVGAIIKAALKAARKTKLRDPISVKENLGSSVSGPRTTAPSSKGLKGNLGGKDVKEKRKLTSGIKDRPQIVRAIGKLKKIKNKKKFTEADALYINGISKDFARGKASKSTTGLINILEARLKGMEPFVQINKAKRIKKSGGSDSLSGQAKQLTKKEMEALGYKVTKRPMGGKVYKNTVSRKHGGAIGVGSALRGFGKGYKKG